MLSAHVTSAFLQGTECDYLVEYTGERAIGASNCGDGAVRSWNAYLPICFHILLTLELREWPDHGLVGRRWEGPDC